MDTDTHHPLDASDGGGDATQEGSRAAAQLLEMAARDAELWRTEAKSEAAAVVEAARAEAAQLTDAGRAEAERLTSSARTEAQRVVSDARSEADRVRGELERTRQGLDGEVARLQKLENETRERLHTHLTSLLDQVDSSGPESADDDGQDGSDPDHHGSDG